MSHKPAPKRIQRNPEVLSRDLDGEAVLAHLGSGIYFGLNEIGTRIWSCIGHRGGDGVTLEEIVAVVTAEFEVDESRARSDVEGLLADLERRGLILCERP